MTINQLILELKGQLHDLAMELSDLRVEAFELQQTLFHTTGKSPNYTEASRLSQIQARMKEINDEIQPALNFIQENNKSQSVTKRHVVKTKRK